LPTSIANAVKFKPSGKKALAKVTSYITKLILLSCLSNCNLLTTKQCIKMSEMPNNPFLEGSEEIPDEEVQAAAKALAEEAAAVRARSHEIKEKAAKARTAKEVARKAEMARIEAEIKAAREQVIKTVASIPKASDKPTLRPAPPPTSEAAVLSSGSLETGLGRSNLLEEPVSLLSFICDFASAAAAIIFVFLIFKEM
jgi:hypothetical protein